MKLEKWKEKEVTDLYCRM